MGERQAQRQTGFVYHHKMLTKDLLDQWLPQLHQPAVRDLAWTLLAAPLLSDTGCPQRHPLTASDWHRQPALLLDWLLVQDQQPARLQEWLAGARSQRLGIYYESLWQFALQQAPGITLLAANLPVRQDGRTLGEIDLLLRDTEGTHHLELAIKLYLGPEHDNGHLPANWRGAGRADNLERKLQHLTNKQLPLSANPAAQETLAAHGISALHAELWLSGYLFYPWPRGCAVPVGGHPAHARGHWLRQSDWPAFIAGSTAHHWQPVPRDCRLAPLRLDHGLRGSTAQLQRWQNTQPDDAPPCLLAGFTEQADGCWVESARVMLLSDQWPVETQA